MAAHRAERVAQAADDYLVIGRVVGPHGVRGELKIAIQSEDPQRFAALEFIYLGDGYRRYAVQGARLHKGRALLLLDGVADRDAAERLRGQVVSVHVQDAIPLEDGAYYYHQVEGLQVIDAGGQTLGILHEILPTGANDVYVIRGPRGELLLPAIRDVVLAIEPEHGRIIVRIPPGLTEEH